MNTEQPIEEQEAPEPTAEQSEADKLSTSTFISTQRAKYIEIFPEHSSIDSALQTLRETYEAHTIVGVDDKDGYEFAKNGLRTLLKIRQGTEGKFKQLNAIAKEYTEALKTDSAKIILEVQRLEKTLKDKVKVIDDAKEAAKQKKAKEALERFNSRVDQLFGIGFKMGPDGYELGTMIVSVSSIQNSEDPAWVQFFENASNTAKIQKDNEAKRQAEEEALRVTNTANAERIAELEQKAAEMAAELEALRNPKPAESAQSTGTYQPVRDNTGPAPTPAFNNMVQTFSSPTASPVEKTMADVEYMAAPAEQGQSGKTADSPILLDPQPLRPDFDPSPMIVMMEPIYRQFITAGKSDKDFAPVRRRIIAGGNCIADAVIDLLNNHPKCQRSELIAIVESMKIIDPVA